MWMWTTSRLSVSTRRLIAVSGWPSTVIASMPAGPSKSASCLVNIKSALALPPSTRISTPLSPGSWASAVVANSAPAAILRTTFTRRFYSRVTVVATVLWRGLVGEHRAVILVISIHSVHDRQEDAGGCQDRIHRDVHDVVAEAPAIRPAAGHRVAVAVDERVAAEHTEAVEAGRRRSVGHSASRRPPC